MSARVLLFNYSSRHALPERQLSGCPRTSRLLELTPTSHHLLPHLFFFWFLFHKDARFAFSVQPPSQLRRPLVCTPMLHSAAAVFPSCFQVGSVFLNQNSCLILRPPSCCGRTLFPVLTLLPLRDLLGRSNFRNTHKIHLCPPRPGFKMTLHCFHVSPSTQTIPPTLSIAFKYPHRNRHLVRRHAEDAA